MNIDNLGFISGQNLPHFERDLVRTELGVYVPATKFGD